MSYQELKRPHAGFHPEQIKYFEPQKGMLKQRELTATKYDGLTNSSAYASYAWAFLRRNKFYQALIDADSKDFNSLSTWGYRQSDNVQSGAEWEYHCGLWTSKLHKLKPYCEGYDEGTPLLWYPIEYVRQSICGGLGHNTTLEDKTTQLHITLDLGHKFGPNVAGIDKQLEIARQCIEARYKARAGRVSLAELEVSVPKKENLRRYLYIADQLTGKHSVKTDTQKRLSATEVPSKSLGQQELKVNEVAKRLSTKLKDETHTIDSIGKDSKKAFQYVYQWQCLALLTLRDEK